MKIKFSYLPEEQQEAAGDLAVLLHRHPKAKVRRVADKRPRKQIYISTPEKKSCK